MKQKIILAVIAVAVAGLFVGGILNGQQVAAWARRLFYQGRGTVARATELKAPQLHDPQAAQICRDNLRRIENAKRRVAQDRGGMAVGRLTWDDIKAELPGHKIPVCPAGGQYSLGNLGSMPKCTIGASGTAMAEDDHIVINY